MENNFEQKTSSDKLNFIQEEIIESGVKYFSFEKNGYYDIAMRVGKTRICLKTIEKIIENNAPKDLKVLISYKDNKQLSSWKKEIEKWSHLPIESFYFCNFSSLKKYQNIFFNFFICDEFHALSEKQIYVAKIISQNSSKNIFLSGTIEDEVKLKWPEFKCIYKYTTEQGVKDGILADYKITVYVVPLDNKIKYLDGNTEKQKYAQMTSIINHMEMHRKRETEIFWMRLKRSNICSMSINKKKVILKLLEEKSNKRVLVFTKFSKIADSLGIKRSHSNMNKEESVKNFNDFISGKFNHLALASMGKVGITYPLLDTVIISSLTYNVPDNIQMLNRCLMLDYKDKIADLVIISSSEESELKKVKHSLKSFNKDKIHFNYLSEL